MRWRNLALPLLGFMVLAAPVHAQSLWARRDPQTAYLFVDNRARHVGDLLTILINETTEMEGMDKTELNKQTSTSASATANGNASAGSNLVRKFAGEFDALVNSQRKFDGKANTTIDRRLVDRMAVMVVGVLPNGLLMVEGKRSRVISKEDRTLVVRGIVRPLDIGPGNTIQSQFIADFTLSYDGCGPESSYTQHGWLGRIVNKIWPF
jgi:flagellar L-ring protein FlgH